MPAVNGEFGYLVQWIGVDDEKGIHLVLSSDALAPLLRISPMPKQLSFRRGFHGAVRLLDSAELGSDLRRDSQLLALLPGSYQVRAAYFEINGIMIVVREISQLR